MEMVFSIVPEYTVLVRVCGVYPISLIEHNVVRVNIPICRKMVPVDSSCCMDIFISLAGSVQLYIKSRDATKIASK